MEIKEQVQQIAQHKVVLVCGLFKSGTSAITGILEKHFGFFNPATVTNKQEQAYARDASRYETNECLHLRQLNEAILLSQKSRDDYANLITKYLKPWKRPLVLKDPKLVMTLGFFMTTLAQNEEDFAVVFTHRNTAELATSWQKAPYTKQLLQNDPQAIETLLRHQTFQIENCQNAHVPHIELHIEQIKAYSKALEQA